MLIKEIINKKIPKIYADDPLGKAIKILVKVPHSALPVINNKGKVIGELNQSKLMLLFTSKDSFDKDDSGIGFRKIRMVLLKQATKVKDLMEKHSITLSPEDDINIAARLIYDKGISTIPVVDKNGNLLGIVSDIEILNNYVAKG